MTEITDMAAKFKAKCEQQANAIQANALNELSLHEQSLLTALKSSERTLIGAMASREAEILAHFQKSQNSLKGLQYKGLIEITAYAVMLLLTLGGVGWMLGLWVEKNATLLIAQESKLRTLEAQGIELIKSAEGSFIVLPKGMTVERKHWDVDGQVALKIEE